MTRQPPTPRCLSSPRSADGAKTEGIVDADSTPVQHLPDDPSLEVPEEEVIPVGNPGRRRTPEQAAPGGRFRRAHQRVRKSVPVRRRKARTSPPELLAQPEPNPTELKAKADAPGTEGIADADSTPVQRLPDAPSLHVPEERVVSAQVPALVRSIHSWLTSNVSAGHVLDKTLLALTEAHPVDVAITLLRCAPSCDRYGPQLPRGLRAHQPLEPITPCPWKHCGSVPRPLQLPRSGRCGPDSSDAEL
ncbi:uncharacterized protein LOC127469383 [Manacus candei]|uniref:uncharacterized protein LOC127469383 n=1 Tax=Manacus candei TaxID=415023 RepID=UPI00222709B3|nr:uncharacterized protein LOC127469383 [Manacus candei]